MIDYSIFYRRRIRTDRIGKELPKFDVFISAYNSSDRVREVFLQTKAKQKIWLVHPEYQFSSIEEPDGGIPIRPTSTNEVDQINSLLRGIGELRSLNLCIDTTGFMRHALVFLTAKLATMGVKTFTALYSEPQYYAKQEHTLFSTTTTGKVRPVMGTIASSPPTARDILVFAIGYDHKLVGEVAGCKDSAVVYPIFAFPSLAPDMYQQSVMRAANSGDIALDHSWITNRRFAPANDPFSTAQIVQEVVHEIDRSDGPVSIYLSPLSTKVQTLGFALYWQLEGRLRGDTSVLLPECVTYSRETSHGLKKLWAYTVEL